LDGFTLHLMVHDVGERLAWCLMPGHVDDRKPVPAFAKGLGGQLFGDRGYMSQALPALLVTQGLALVTKIRKTMKHRLRRWGDKRRLRTRARIETSNDPTGCEFSAAKHFSPRS
jgi:hypothetical protein